MIKLKALKSGCWKVGPGEHLEVAAGDVVPMADDLATFLLQHKVAEVMTDAAVEAMASDTKKSKSEGKKG